MALTHEGKIALYVACSILGILFLWTIKASRDAGYKRKGRKVYPSKSFKSFKSSKRRK